MIKPEGVYTKEGRLLYYAKVPSKYKSIPGGFNFQKIYSDAVDNAEDGAQFLEIGCWAGKSTVYLGEVAKCAEKDIDIHVIDTFDSSGNEGLITELDDLNLEKRFRKNLELADLQDIVVVYPGTSNSVFESGVFEDNFFDFIFIDGSHEYDDVISDIKNALKKIKPHGVIAGHDYQHPPVKKAVDELLTPLEFYENSWIYKG